MHSSLSRVSCRVFVQAELVHLRAEVAEARARRAALELELHRALLELHAEQLHRHGEAPDTGLEEAAATEEALRRVELELRSATEQRGTAAQPIVSEAEEARQLLLAENAALRNSLLALHSEVYGARLAAKYLDKELAGR